MAGLVEALVTGQNFALDSATPIANLAADANAATIVTAVNALLAELRANGMIKPTA